MPERMGLNGFGRWDLSSRSPLHVDLEERVTTKNLSFSDGTNGPVIVAPAPDHRSFKGQS